MLQQTNKIQTPYLLLLSSVASRYIDCIIQCTNNVRFLHWSHALLKRVILGGWDAWCHVMCWASQYIMGRNGERCGASFFGNNSMLFSNKFWPQCCMLESGILLWSVVSQQYLPQIFVILYSSLTWLYSRSWNRTVFQQVPQRDLKIQLQGRLPIRCYCISKQLIYKSRELSCERA